MEELHFEFAPGVVELELEDIVPNPLNVRIQTGEKGLAELADSIRREGLLHPVVVRSAQNERYELVCGERRWRAFCKLAASDPAWSRIPARVVRTNDAGVLALMHRENTMRNDWLPYEKALFYKQAWDSGRFASLRATAATLDLGLTTLHRYLRIFELPKKFLHLFETGAIGMLEVEVLVEAPSALRDRILQGFRNENWGKREARRFLRSGAAELPGRNTGQLLLQLKAAGVAVSKGRNRVTFTCSGSSVQEALATLMEVAETGAPDGS